MKVSRILKRMGLTAYVSTHSPVGRRGDLGITRRDGYVMGKALAYAIAAIQCLPCERQEWSDCRDMIALLRNMYPDAKKQRSLADLVEEHLGWRPDFTDEKGGDIAPIGPDTAA